MGNGELGLLESVSMALGGMIGGGIFAVIGVELLYFERDWLVAEAEQLGDEMASLEAESESETEN